MSIIWLTTSFSSPFKTIHLLATQWLMLMSMVLVVQNDTMLFKLTICLFTSNRWSNVWIPSQLRLNIIECVNSIILLFQSSLTHSVKKKANEVHNTYYCLSIDICIWWCMNSFHSWKLKACLLLTKYICKFESFIKYVTG